MTTIKFTDGMSFHTDGEPRLVRKSDGLYVVGGGMLCPVDDEAEGRELIARMKKSEGSGR
jgi:hypothetical protein